MRWMERGLWCVGATLFAVLVYRFGWHDLLGHLSAVGWGITLVFAQEMLAFAANTLGWRWSFPRGAQMPSFAQLLAARIAGDAFNYVTPTASLGGEFVRLQMLAAGSPRLPLAASLSVAKLAQTMGQVAFIVIGLVVVAPHFSLPEPVQWGAWVTLAVFCCASAGMVWWQRRGMFAPALAAAERIGWLPAPKWRQRLLRLDDEIRSLHRDPVRFWLSVIAFAVGWALGTLEMYLVLWLLDIVPSWPLALAIEVFSATLDGMLFFVPAKLGTQEGGKVFIFSVMGLDPAKGFAAGVLRRMRELFWAAVGLLLWRWKVWGQARVATAQVP